MPIRNTTKDWEKAYEKIAKLTQLSFDEVYDKRFVLIKDLDSEYYGQIGIRVHSFYKGSDWYVVAEFLSEDGKRKKETILVHDYPPTDLEKKVFSSPNAIMILEERAQLNDLF